MISHFVICNNINFNFISSQYNVLSGSSTFLLLFHLISLQLESVCFLLIFTVSSFLYWIDFIYCRTFVCLSLWKRTIMNCTVWKSNYKYKPYLLMFVKYRISYNIMILFPSPCSTLQLMKKFQQTFLSSSEQVLNNVFNYFAYFGSFNTVTFLPSILQNYSIPFFLLTLIFCSQKFDCKSN